MVSKVLGRPYSLGAAFSSFSNLLLADDVQWLVMMLMMVQLVSQRSMAAMLSTKMVQFLIRESSEVMKKKLEKKWLEEEEEIEQAAREWQYC